MSSGVELEASTSNLKQLEKIETMTNCEASYSAGLVEIEIQQSSSGQLINGGTGGETTWCRLRENTRYVIDFS